MKQQTLATNDFEQFRKPTRRDKFLAEMNTVVPWVDLVAVIEPYYPKASSVGGRPPVGLERMLRIHCLQLWFDLSDPAVEEALYDSRAMRSFAGIDLGREPVPDETTVMRFRHLLEEHKLGSKIFEEVGRVLQRRGLRLSKGTIVDATIIAAPSSTKNADGERDPEMHQTKKGQQWYFGMKMHVGVDSQHKVIHTVAVTPANTADCKVMGQLLHGQRRGSTAIRRTRARRKSFAPRRRRPRTSPTGNVSGSISWTRRSKQRTATSRASGHESSIRSASSSGCLDSPKCAIAVWPRTATACS